jgi:hypothetical protein
VVVDELSVWWTVGRLEESSSLEVDERTREAAWDVTKPDATSFLLTSSIIREHLLHTFVCI